MNTPEAKPLGVDGFYNIQDQVGGFLGGISDAFEGRFNGLSQTGRQKIAEKWRPALVKLGNHMLRAKPQDIRDILDSEIYHMIEGEDLGKAMRLAMEVARIDNYLGGDYRDISSLNQYMIKVALEQDAK